MNSVQIVGRLGRDPETVTTKSMTRLCYFSVATSNGKDKDPDWHNVTAFGKTAQIAQEYLKKGDMVGINGRLSTSEWTDQEGNKRKKVSVIANHISFYGKSASSTDDNGKSSKPKKEIKTLDDVDEIPF